MLDFIKRILRGVAPTPVCACGKPRIISKTTLRIEDEDVVLTESDYCIDCAILLLNKQSTRCAQCGKLILPGEPVSGMPLNVTTIKRPDMSFVHNTMECSYVGGYMGKWGEGFLVPYKRKEAQRVSTQQEKE